MPAQAVAAALIKPFPWPSICRRGETLLALCHGYGDKRRLCRAPPPVARAARERLSNHQDLIGLSAVALLERLRRGEVTPHDLLDALEARIGAVDAKVNALPTLCFDRAHAHADALMRRPPAERGRLAGLPVPIKDLTAVAGVRCTYGSPIFADFTPNASDVLVERLETEGGVVYAKS